MSDIVEDAAIAEEGLDHDAIRLALRTEMAASGRTGADSAKLIGLGGSTLLAWINGKYGGNNDVVSRKVKTWLESRTAQARVQSTQIQVCFTATPTALAFVAALEVAQFAPDLVVLAGGAGVGKTTTCRHYARTHRNVWYLTAEPAVSSGFAVLERLCATLGVRESSPAARSQGLAQKMLGSSGLIIVDEAQHLKTDAVEQLRSLHDVAGVGLALVGNEQVYGRIDGGGRRAEFAQLFSRVGMRVRRPKPYREDIEALLDANDVTGDAERRLLKVIAGKPGALRGMVKTLRVARMLAQADEQPFGASHVRAAWSRVSDTTPLDSDAA
jgi:hypothetical protein